MEEISPFINQAQIELWHELAYSIYQKQLDDLSILKTSLDIQIRYEFSRLLKSSNMFQSIRSIRNSNFYSHQVHVCEVHGHQRNAEILFNKAHGYSLDFSNPVTLNEKLTIMKLNANGLLSRTCSDKLAVRDYVSGICGSEILVPLYNVLHSASDINEFGIEQDSFVVKANHDSGSSCICYDRNQFDWARARLKISDAMSRDYSYLCSELQYKDMSRSILVESLLDKSSYREIQVHCFSGKPLYITLSTVSSTEISCNFYDTEWRPIPMLSSCPWSPKPKEKPFMLNDALDISSRLSMSFHYARIDLYLLEKKIYFGEITLTPHAGLKPFLPPKWDYILGSHLTSTNMP